MRGRNTTTSGARPPPHILLHASRGVTMHRNSAEEKDEEAPGVAYTLTNAEVVLFGRREL